MRPLAVFQSESKDVQKIQAMKPDLTENWQAPEAQAPCSFTVHLATGLPYDSQVSSPLVSDPLMCLPAHQWPEAKYPCRTDGPIWYTQKCSRKRDRQRYLIPSLLIANLFLLAFLLIRFSVYYHALTHFPGVPSCPQGWHEHMGRCYFFSNTEASWIFSQSNCSSFGGSLLMFDTLEEMDYIIDTQIHLYNWIGLQREDVEQPWHLPNDSVFRDSFPITGEGRCAYLNENEVSSTWCDNRRYWICRKP
ncbi:early activation antigen CD69-like [Tiliqua scincoides]|uniref:early activation antigen CD69-like n=1 Tax=Tiliqua scincoides TaxID=71010 RepID=UPI0034625A72